jgi:hypothetical protein
MVIHMNNYCNLSCFSCGALSHTPMGSNTFRDKPRDTEPWQAELFFKRIENYRPHSFIRLSGGEPTLSPHLEDIVAVTQKYGRKVSLLTNGARLMEYDPFIFDNIGLDNHGTNEELLMECVEFLESKNYRAYDIFNNIIHHDLELRRRGPRIHNTRSCTSLRLTTLWQDLVSPCCASFLVEGWDNHTRVTDTLREAGWTIHNPNLVWLIKNLRESIPDIFYESCFTGCWQVKHKGLSRPCSSKVVPGTVP